SGRARPRGDGRLHLRRAPAPPLKDRSGVRGAQGILRPLRAGERAGRELSPQPLVQPRPQSCRVASRAPSAIAANFSHTTLGWTSLNRTPEAAKPQSAPAMTFSRPTILA